MEALQGSHTKNQGPCLAIPKMKTFSHKIGHLDTNSSKMAVFSGSLNSVASNGSPAPKSAAQLEEEIAVIDLELIDMERHLLCLYQNAFGGHLPTIPSSSSSNSLVHHLQTSPAQSSTTSYNPSPATALETSQRMHLFHILQTCQSPSIPAALSASPTSSTSSSSIFSSTHPCDICNDDTSAVNLQGSTEDNGQYAAMTEVLKISLDDENFNDAAIMLQDFRSLVRNLEKVDPRKMNREEKVAFWINIHNALVMHAYLANGSRRRVKSASVLKAACNVGGHCVNAYVIQSSILGIRPHHSSTVAGNSKHAYALEYPEPLVHFALCLGAYSDPAVRAYTANNIFQELKVAKEEFIQAGVYIHMETQIFLPKILYYFAKEMLLSMHELLEMIIDTNVSQVQKNDVAGGSEHSIDHEPFDQSIKIFYTASTFIESDFNHVRVSINRKGQRAAEETDLIRSLIEEEKDAVLRRLEHSIETHPDDSSLRFDLALFLWENWDDDWKEAAKAKEKAAEHFLVSAKLNPQNGVAFRYLGHYYTCVSLDLQRALKCYQRALSLNPDDSDSGEALCDLLDDGGKESLEVSVCKEASEKSPRAFWAFRRLGYLQVHQNKWSEAVQSLQHAIRGYPTCADLWEALGLAYHRLGRFTAAIKSYGRAIELEATRVFALVESGHIFLMLGSFRKGVEQFQQALQISPQCVSAHYGLASGLLGLAKECIYLGAFQWGATLLDEASEVSKESTHLAGNLSCIWKLNGDIQLSYAECYPWMKENQVLEFDEETFNTSILSWRRTCCLAAISAKFSYQRALLLAPWQANIYTDIAISLDLIDTLSKSSGHDLIAWQPPEKMALGALLLEAENYELWVALGCLADHKPLKQHALVRGLQLDVSLAVAWAYLGKLYRKEGEKKLAKQAFDCSRSIDPSLALPWAGMSADFHSREPTPDEAFESCLRAVQILPLAEFQIGLAKLALVSGHLSSSQVFGAIRQAIQRAPHYPECHNLNGLSCESRFDYRSAVASYRLARYAVSNTSSNVSKSLIRDISINLARSLSRAGNALEALQECEVLKKEGLLDAECLQIYAISLWQLGKNDLALSVARNLAVSVPNMEQMSAAVSVSLICRLLYSISGLSTASNSILKMPKELFQSSKISFIVSAINALDRSNRLESVVSSSRCYVKSDEEISRMHNLIALGKLLKHGSEYCLEFQTGIAHLRKALHMYPNSGLLRSLLGYLLLFNEQWNDTHVATRCCNIDASFSPIKEGLKTANEILGAGAIACYAASCSNPKFSFPTCTYQCLNEHGAIQQLQKCLHLEPWNHTLRYLLVLNLLQKAREERFPRNLCMMLERLIFVALSNDCYLKTDTSYQYQKFQLLLCASEISLQFGNQTNCINHAKNASSIMLPDGYLFFAHLLLCRAYALEDDIMNLQKEYVRCLELKTDCDIGWICLKYIESQCKVQTESNILELNLKECSWERKNSGNTWMCVFDLVQGLISTWNHNFLSAEEFLAQACLLASRESCLQLCHGVTCMELARKWSDSQFLSLAVRSLTKAQEASIISLPIVSALLAQAEGSLGSKEKWKNNLRLEWFTWPPEMRPAELFFQMHLLARQSEASSDSSKVEYCQSPQRWVLRAIHTNPSCMRYWKVLQKLGE
ncbi:hypothetical protein FNV43_RR12140 [Rhamnella rubrinervis]|uniref:DUF547 domain-containing protein n=1 Tax=Rhamnella rubrinervis TaxID=2594499 RepID=A0A8K0MIK8_9ROSA|nr:hypothetical protein FNV43_RR12140 [Rhamnella rubrinervis]